MSFFYSFMKTKTTRRALGISWVTVSKVTGVCIHVSPSRLKQLLSGKHH